MYKSFWNKAFPCLLLALLAGHLLLAQTTSWQRYKIGNSGCSVNFPERPAETNFSLDVDSNKVFIARAETKVNKETYVYTVQVLQLRNPDAADDDYDLLTQYLDFVKSTLNIAEEEGYKKINGLTRGKLAKAISDSWSDHTGLEFKVMGWIQGRTIAILYVMGQGPLPASTGIQHFFNGFQFPAAF